MKINTGILIRTAVVASILSLSAQAQTTNFKVYSLFVMNIAKYSSWPEAATEFHIAVVGKSKVYDELLAYSSREINGAKIKVSQVDNLADIGQPQILYLSDGKSSQLEEILKITQGKAVMVVTEREGLYKKGAGFSFFVTETNNLRFDINNTELERRRIKVAKNLSGLAHDII